MNIDKKRKDAASGRVIIMIREITKKEFEERFPEVSTYGVEQLMPVFLENGVVLTEDDWNGETYTVSEGGKERTFKPVQEPDVTDENGEVLQWKITGYEEL